jgi:hypothetical protein
MTDLTDKLFLKTNASTTLADRSCKCFCLSDFDNSSKFGGKSCFVGNDYLLSIPNTVIAAAITLDLNTVMRKSLFGRYDDETSAVTLRRLMTVRSANIVQVSLLDFPEKNLAKII